MKNVNGRMETTEERLENIRLDSPIWLGDREITNRMVHQPMECEDSFHGFPTELTLKRYRNLAKGRAGITIVEATTVTSASRSSLHQLIADEEHREGIEKLTSEFKKINEDTILCYQLTHPGARSNPKFSEVVRIYDIKDSGGSVGRVLETSEIREVRDAFIKGAQIVHDSGADMVDVKLCHGYLTCEILRPANTRNDEYGGSLENRMRLAREIIEGIKERIPDPNFKIMARFSVYESISRSGTPIIGGVGAKGPASIEFSADEPCEMLRMLVDYGVDIVNITGGATILPKVPKEFIIDDPQTYSTYHFLDYARRAKELNLGVPVISTGFSLFGKDISTVGENSILYGYADMVGIGRQILADPDIKRILAGNANYCLRCGGCMELMMNRMPGGCTQYDDVYKLLRESTRLSSKTP